jgi:hypothetical protein
MHNSIPLFSPRQPLSHDQVWVGEGGIELAVKFSRIRIYINSISAMDRSIYIPIIFKCIIPAPACLSPRGNTPCFYVFNILYVYNILKTHRRNIYIYTFYIFYI